MNISSQKSILTVFVVSFLKVEIHEHFSFMQPALADEFQKTIFRAGWLGPYVILSVLVCDFYGKGAPCKWFEPKS